MHGRIRTWGPGALVLLPTVLLLGYFVYGLIAWSFNTSLTNRHTARKGPADYVGLENYGHLFGEDRFLNSLKNFGVSASVARDKSAVSFRDPDGIRVDIGG